MMFTPQGKGWTGWSTPAPADQQIGCAAVASPTLGKGRVVPKRLTELEKELHEYQYSMGLLLIEKKEWAAKYDQTSQALTQNEEILKREQAAHLNAIYEYEKREESIRKALCVEKQCVADLEKALHEMRSEIAEVRFMSQKKMADVHSLEAHMDEKSLAIEGKLHVANVKLAEANRKMPQADRKFEEIEARPCRSEKEELFHETEWKAQEEQLKGQGESLHDWDKRLKEIHNRLVDLQRSLNDREERANENDKILKMKQEELLETKQAVESTNIALKIKEDDIDKRLHELHAHEKDIETKHKSLEKKEKKLADWEDKINVKEKLGLQKSLEVHKAGLESKRQDFELVLKRERESFSEEMAKRVADMERREKDVKSKEDNLLKSEQELNWNTQKLDGWKNDLDLRSQALKKLEEALKTHVKKVSEDMQQIESERKDIDMYKLDLESTKAVIEAEKQNILTEQEKYELTKEDREEHSRLVVQLKQEIEGCRAERNSLSKEADDLRQQKLKFEKAGQELEKKRTYVEEEAKKLNNERTRLERWHGSEKRRLKDVELEVEVKYKKQVEDIRLKEEALMGDIEHQRLQNNQLLEGEHADIQRNFQLHRHKLEMEMEQKQVRKEKELEEQQNELNKKLDLVENKITSAVDLNESKIQKIIFEKKELEREREVLVKDRQKLETDKADIKKDIDSLNMLSKSMKERREVYKKEKNHLVGLIDKYKVCKTCGVSVFDGLDVLGLQGIDTQCPNLAIEEDDHSLSTEALPQGTGRLVNSGGRFSLLQKCSRLFKFSPSKMAEHSLEQQVEKPVSFGAKLDEEASEHEENYKPTPIYEVANDSFAQEFPSGSRTGEKEEFERISSGESESFSFGVADNLLITDSGDNNNNMAFDENIILDDRNGKEYSNTPEGALHPETLIQGQRQQNREGGLRVVRRTRTIQAVVEEAKKFIGQNSEEKNNCQKDSVATRAGQKRNFAHLSGATTIEEDVEDSEIYSDGVSLGVSLGGQLRKRQQTGGPAKQLPGENRYNLRRNRVVNTATTAQTTSGKTRAVKAGSKQKTRASSDDNAKGTSSCEDPDAQRNRTSGLKISTELNVVKVHESSPMILLAEAGEAAGEARYPVENTNKDDDDAVDGKAIVPDFVPSTPSDGELGAEDDEEDGDESPRGNQSIGKKLWSLFTT